MADNNFSINVDINANGQQQINQYKAAFDGLRASITNLSLPITKLDDDVSKLSESVGKLKSESDPVNDTLTKIKKTSEDAAPIVKAFTTAIEFLTKGTISLEAALTGGLTVLLAFGPQALEFIKSLTNGKEAVDKAKLSINAMNGALQSSDYSNAVKQINELKINIGLTRKGFLDKKEVLEQYNTTVGKTMGQVSNFNDLESKVTKNGASYIKMTLLKASAQLALQDAAKKAYEAEQTKLKSDDDVLTFWDKTKDFMRRGALSVVNSPAGFMDANAEVDKINTAKKRREEAITDATNQKNALITIATKFESDAAEISNKSGYDFFNGKIVTNNNGASSRGNSTALQDMADKFAKQAAIAKNYHEAELKDFKDQLAKKQITQAEYEVFSTERQDKYHEGIKTAIKIFNDQDLAQALQHQKDLVETQQLSKDQHDVDKAILPANKLATEKQLITDKYNFEIQKAAEAGKDTADIRQKYQQEMAAADKQFAQQRKDFELQTAQQVSNAAFSILQNNIKSQSDAKIKQLETQKQAELNNSSLTASQKQAIEDKYKKKEAAEKVKAFKAEQKASILQAVINGALAVTKVTAQTGVFAAFTIPAIIAETAIQVATIAAQKTPQYAKGGLHYQSDGKGTLLSGYSRTDNTNAYLRSGEAVVVSEAMRNPWARNLVSAINVAHGGRDFSITNPGRGYAIGGIFTDGGNSNRYYNQPMNDQKDLANTIAYQMINNFPPVYVDVKDINSQQNILAQTVNRVNL
ncbi:hypothetical protein [Mucilaginibacter sp.]|uniref:hypothetical protein n=1 Tax=Mucilaginibacter sp. TaxID=1882438 RepID=UPI002622E05B|nr:hypothetical protein [Mucilaginibacter sp.]MDB4926780.1 smc 2 [Mucilaginibacter sp.]